jgi:hypothetical protein
MGFDHAIKGLNALHPLGILRHIAHLEMKFSGFGKRSKRQKLFPIPR